ncbi:MAG TPA: peptidyl-prolyl cis-trans isomerase, partial [Candidatus Limnocylindria bacterium]|nr:peptidyl-prolyl cis-trans isomerase [Candidatus Limnocylindria bacterium]
LIRQEATLVQLRAAGFDREPQTVTAIERMLVARFEERELAAAEAPTVSDAEVQAAYAAEAARYTIPAAVRGGVLLLKASPKAAAAQRAEVRRQAEQLRTEAVAADAAGFERLVREHSEDQSTRYQGGDTGWLEAGQNRGGWEPAIANALHALAGPGECAPVVETPGGFCLVRLTEKRAAGIRPLAEVGPAIRHRLQRAKREQLTAAFQSRMRAGLAIRTNTAVLAETLVTAHADPQPPSLP